MVSFFWGASLTDFLEERLVFIIAFGGCCCGKVVVTQHERPFMAFQVVAIYCCYYQRKPQNDGSSFHYLHRYICGSCLGSTKEYRKTENTSYGTHPIRTHNHIDRHTHTQRKNHIFMLLLLCFLDRKSKTPISLEENNSDMQKLEKKRMLRWFFPM